MAGRSLGVLTLDLILKSGGFEAGMDKAARVADARSKQISRSIGRLTTGIVAGLSAITAGFSFGAIIRSTAEAEKALAALDNAVKNNAGAAGITTPELAKMATELQSLTTYSDEAVMQMQGLLLSFKQIGGGEFKRAQTAVLDLATALGQDLSSSARLVGRALADPIKGMTALSRAGVVLDKDQKELIKSLTETGHLAEAQGIILKELESRFGGAARAARNTFGGALEGLHNAFGDLLEAKGGMPEAVESLNALSAVLQDPATIAAASSLTSALISGFTGVAKAIADTVGATKFLAEELAAIHSGAAADDLVRLGDELKLVEDLRNSSALSRVRFFGKDGIVKFYDKAELDQEIARLKGLIKDASIPTASLVGGGGTGSAGPVAPLPPSEEFIKFAERLKEQIALYGKTGEAAKLAYQIQTDGIEGLTAAEGKELIALAKRYDALVESAKVQKEAQQAQESALKNVEGLVTALELQVATYDQSAAAVLRYRIEQGDLAKTFADAGAAADPYKEQLIALTSQMTDLEKATEAAKKQQAEFDALMSEGQSVIESTRTPLEKLNAEYERLNKLRDAGALGSGAEGDETYRRAIEAAQEAFDKGSKDSEAFNEQFKDGVFRSLQEGIYTGITDGAKSGWKGFLEAGLNTINQLVAAALAKKLAEILFGDDKEGSGGFLNSVIGAFFGPGKASGGPVSAGTIYPVNERELEFFKPNSNGRIIPLAQMAPSSGSRGVEQNIYVQGRVDARTASQLATKTAQRQRIATARLG